MARLQLNFETFGAIGAIVVSVAALFVAYDQAVVLRIQQHAAVIPIMTVDMNVNQNAESNIIELIISNVGVGPALVMSAVPTLGDEPVRRWSHLSDQMFGEDFEESIRLSASTATTVFGVGESETVLGMRWDRSEVGDAKIIEMAQALGAGTMQSLSVELCYCSVLDRCWVSGRSDLNYPEPVDQCEASGDFLQTFFQSIEDANPEEISP